MGLRLLGAFLVIAASGLMGIVLSLSYEKRVKALEEFLSALTRLETEMQYGKRELPESFLKVAENAKGVVKSFFLFVHLELTQREALNVKVAWEKGGDILLKGPFTPKDRKALGELGPILGLSDVSDQIRHIELTKTRLSALLGEARQEREKNVRLLNYLGFCLGALLVILLF